MIIVAKLIIGVGWCGCIHTVVPATNLRYGTQFAVPLVRQSIFIVSASSPQHMNRD